MVAALLPVFDPTPSSVAEIASRLPAHERARIEWFPQALRKTFIEPLTRASRDEFSVRLDELTVDAVRTVLQLAANLGVRNTAPPPAQVGAIGDSAAYAHRVPASVCDRDRMCRRRGRGAGRPVARV